MNKSKIEWCDYTWNPVTGCLHGCEYCYAERIAKRFRSKPEVCGKKCIKSHTEDFVCYEGKYNCAFPYGFKPTFYKERLIEPQKLKKPSKIFVVSMGDLFGEGVPDEWIEEVLSVVKECPQHTFIYLTKNPSKYRKYLFGANCAIGVTIENQEAANRRVLDLLNGKRGTQAFLSIEPLNGPVNLCRIEPHGKEDVIVNALKGEAYVPFSTLKNRPKLDWVIIGQQTGPGAKPPKPEWVQSIIDQCKEAGVPVFVKPPLYEKFPIQEFPKGM